MYPARHRASRATEAFSMADSELRRRLTELAHGFVEDVLAAIQSASLSDIALEVANHDRNGAGARAEETSRRKLVRRKGDEIRRVKGEILRVLEDARRPIGAAEIARQIGEQTVSLAFPMAQLRDAGVVHKEGERTQAVYSLVRHDDEDDRGKKKGKKKR
jgi:DNA-binding transcriptional ArsR family regulator